MNDRDCLFCKIIQGSIPSGKIIEDDMTYAFHDISPQAPIHALVVPKEHVSNLSEAVDHNGMVEACMRTCTAVAELTGINQTGYRIVTNSGPDSCQSVPHLHFHVIGGALLSDRMG